MQAHIGNDLNQNKPNPKGFKAWKWYLAILLFGLLFSNIEHPDPKFREMNVVGRFIMGCLSGTMAVGMVWGVFAWPGYKKKCPKCGKWFGKELVEKIAKGQEFSFKNVTRNVISDTCGEYSTLIGGQSKMVVQTNFVRFFHTPSGMKEWRQFVEQIKVLRMYFDNHFHCTFCLQKWVEESCEDTEDFAIPNQ